mmetsp:Transcript_6402/g.18402  ORF Transcript_6402/g.18402 Transcript_6402/m.18402 type:complete len:276 (-) Transcript_6402:8-835(-)
MLQSCVRNRTWRAHLTWGTSLLLTLAPLLLHGEAHLACAHVHARDPDLNLLAHLEHVCHTLHEAILDLCDVHQALRRGAAFRRRHLHEGTKVCCGHDRALQPHIRGHPFERRQVDGLPGTTTPSRQLALDHRQPELAVSLLLQPDLDFLTLLQVVAHVVHAIIGDLGNVHKPVSIGTEVDEGAKAGDAPDRARVLLADLRLVVPHSRERCAAGPRNKPTKRHEAGERHGKLDGCTKQEHRRKDGASASFREVGSGHCSMWGRNGEVDLSAKLEPK